MPGNSTNVEVNVGAAVEELRDSGDALEEGAEATLRQLVVLAEGAMKREAPEGAGIPSVHMRSTIRTTESEELERTVQPHKRTSEGWLLHRAIVGNPETPTYSGGSKPPVWTDGQGNAQGPLAQWSAAKLGDPNAAWAVANSIAEDGHDSFPNRFIDRSVKSWVGDTERIADREVSAALRRQI